MPTKFWDGEWAGDSEILIIPLISNDICVSTYRLINDINTNTVLGYQFINTYDSNNYINFNFS